MKAFLLSSVFSLKLLLVSGQQIGFSGGYCTNQFYNFIEEGGHTSALYQDGTGYRFNINIDNIGLDSIPIRISVHYENFTGGLTTSDGGMGGGSTTRAEIEKSSLGLSLFPINIRIFKELKLSVGGELSYLVGSEVTGSRKITSISAPGSYTNLHDNQTAFFKAFTFGVIGRVAYNFKIYQNYYLVPEYNYYLGLTREFEDTEIYTYSYRHLYMIGIAKRISR